jgi:hypothetical protein
MDTYQYSSIMRVCVYILWLHDDSPEYVQKHVTVTNRTNVNHCYWLAIFINVCCYEGKQKMITTHNRIHTIKITIYVPYAVHNFQGNLWILHFCALLYVTSVLMIYLRVLSIAVTTRSSVLGWWRTASMVWWSELDSEVWVRFSALPDFLRSSGTGTGSTQPPEYKWGATWKKEQRL